MSRCCIILNNKLKNLLFPSFPNSPNLRTNFSNYKGPGAHIQMSRKITANSAIFQLYHGQDKLIFNVIMMRYTLY
jgi:hypothetical protein